MNGNRLRRMISLRTSLVLVPAILCGVLTFSIVAVMIGQARQRVDSERASAVEIADHLAAAAMAGATKSSGAPLAELIQGLHEMTALRHVRLFVLPWDDDAYRAFVARQGLDGQVPAWFLALLRPPPWERWQPIWLSGHVQGYVVVRADPADEITELWEELEVLLILLGGLVAIFTALVAWSVNRATRPVTLLTAGLAQLEKGNFQESLPPFALPELAPLSDTFNTLAATLRRMDADNRRLIGGLLSVQEAERNLLAAELHDELGPTLFGIRAHASCLLRDPAGKGAAEILGLADELQRLNRRILDRLRPSRLNDLGLDAALRQLAADWSIRQPGIDWIYQGEGLDGVTGADLCLTLYRVAQEALTNAARHSGASRVVLAGGRTSAGELPWAGPAFSENADQILIWLEIRDDGAGFDPAAASGFGIAGMRERIRCRRGIFLVDRGRERGTSIRAAVPEIFVEAEAT